MFQAPPRRTGLKKCCSIFARPRRLNRDDLIRPLIPQHDRQAAIRNRLEAIRVKLVGNDANNRSKAVQAIMMLAAIGVGITAPYFAMAAVHRNRMSTNEQFQRQMTLFNSETVVGSNNCAELFGAEYSNAMNRNQSSMWLGLCCSFRYDFSGYNGYRFNDEYGCSGRNDIVTPVISQTFLDYCSPLIESLCGGKEQLATEVGIDTVIACTSLGIAGIILYALYNLRKEPRSSSILNGDELQFLREQGFGEDVAQVAASKLAERIQSRLILLECSEGRLGPVGGGTGPLSLMLEYLEEPVAQVARP